MKWYPSVVAGPATILVATSTVMIRALTTATSYPTSALQVESGDSILDVLELMAREAVGARVICVSDDVLFREARPGLGAAGFCQHVRLTPALGPLRLLPIVIAVHGDPQQALSANVERLFYCAPGCFPATVSQIVARLLSGRLPSQSFEDGDDLRRAIGPFLLETEGARRTAAHDYRNVAGAGQLLDEFGGDVLDPAEPALVAYRRLAEADLLLKSRRFLIGRRAAPGVDAVTSSLSELRREARGHHVVLVDDEHRRGWGLAIFAGLFGNRPNTIREVTPGVEFHDDRLWCIDSSDAAARTFEQWSDGLHETLDVWANQELDVARARATLRDASARRGLMARRLADAETVVSQADSKATTAGDGLGKAASRLREIAAPAIEALAECYTDATGDLEAILEQKGKIDALNAALDDYQRKLMSAEQASRERDTRRTERDKWRADATSAEKEFAAANDMAKRSEERLRGVQTTLSALAACSVVLLDMRLNPDSDRDRAPTETSGASVLKNIKARFPFLPVVMLTASARAQSVAASAALGADGYWVKHESSGEELARLLRQAFHKSAVHRVWMEIERASAKRVVNVSALDGSGKFQPSSWVRGDRDREVVFQFLHRVCELLYEAAGEQTVGRPRSDSLLRQAMVDLGFIQEMRYDNNKRPADQVWFNKLPSAEQKWRRDHRNRVIHDGDSVTLDHGLEFLKFTVRQLLAD